MARKILLIEDDRDIANLVELHLKDLGFEVKVALDGEVGLHEGLTLEYDLVILDLMLPKMEGLEVCRHLRASQTYIPLLMLTARTSELDRVLGLEVGADDYLTKPFSIRELLARVKALLRRMDATRTQASFNPSKKIRFGELFIDIEKRKVTLQGQGMDLTAKEFDLLRQFAEHPGRVYTRTQLLDLVWGYGHDGYEHTVNSHINRLRAKIEKDPAKPRFILTVWGIGYKFCEDEGLSGT
ncbi:MAG TPA: response regulator transcription factor [Nitrospiria bacterium]